jgi:LuxR family maltose regulon positive regulatory protein
MPPRSRGHPEDTTRPFIASKVSIPGAPPGMICRPRLTTWLDHATRKPVVLLSAPAGWGKTALLASWVRTAVALAPIGWLTLDPGDEAESLWFYLHKALTEALADQEPAAAHGLPEPDAGADVGYLVRLTVALARLPHPVVLVIDDLHELADRRALDGLAFLVRHAGDRIRLVLSTRSDPALPLRRWQVSGVLTELRSTDLAFTPAETADLLNQQGTGLDDAQITALHSRTEGWPAGLRLTLLALNGSTDPALLVDQLGGGHGIVADYLRQEMLTRQPPETIDALLRTAILDRVCGGLMDALTGREDGERILSRLERDNGFVLSLDCHGGWYRYHPMLGDLLLAELRRRPPRPIGELHRLAAEWLSGQGHPAETLHHALGADDWGLAARVVDRHWQDLLICRRSQPRRLAVPPPPDGLIRTDPHLALAYAVNQLDVGDLTSVDSYLDRAGGDAAGATPVAGERAGSLLGTVVDTARLVRAQLGGTSTQIRSLAGQLVTQTDGGARKEDGDEEGARAIGLAALGAAGLGDQDVASAEAALSTGLAAAVRSGSTCQQALCAAQLAVVCSLRGRLRAAGRAARLALTAPSCSTGCHLRRAPLAHLALANVSFQRDQLDDTAHHLELATGSFRALSAPLVIALTALLRSWLLQAHGKPAQARQALLTGGHDLAAGTPSTYLTQWLVAAEADLRAANDDTDGARALLLHPPPQPRPPFALHPPPQPRPPFAPRNLALARIHLRLRDYAGAVDALRGWTDDPVTDGIGWLSLQGQLLEAVARSGVGERREAHRLLEHCLEIACPEGMRRVLVQDCPGLHGLLLQHLDSGTAYWFPVQELVGTSWDPLAHREELTPLADPLTRRELAVLRYLPSALTNADIAAELTVSVHTVKTHVRNIFRKLGVTRRRDAVVRGRELKLL